MVYNKNVLPKYISAKHTPIMRMETPVMVNNKWNIKMILINYSCWKRGMFCLLKSQGKDDRYVNVPKN